MFRKITDNKYLGNYGYNLVKTRDGRFSICKAGQVTNWGRGFATVRAAEIFADRHDLKHATPEFLPIDALDLDFIADMYGLSLVDDNTYSNEAIVLKLVDDGSFYKAILEDDSKEEIYPDALSLVARLDEIFPYDQILSSVILRGKEFRYLFAGKNRRSARDITQNLVRTKSSNVWAYGIEIHEDDSSVGDLYVQFKGKNGGPADIYRYYDVPVKLYRKMITYPSKGSFIWQYLRNGFMYSKLTGDKRGKLKNAIN